MGALKGGKKQKAKNELKRNLKGAEKCPHCKKKVQDLDVHIRTEHSLVCSRCGQRFASDRHWKQHMRDKHGLNANDALRDDRKAKLDKWLKTAGAAPAVEEEVEENEEGMAEEEAEPAQKCELCGAEVRVNFDLASSGLSFQCAFIGQQCRGSSARACLAQASTAPGLAAPAVPGPLFFGAPAGIAAQAAVNQAFGAPQGFFGAAVLGPAAPGQLPHFGHAPPFGASGTSFFTPGAPLPSPSQYASLAAPVAAAGPAPGAALAVAVAMAVPSDDEDL